VQFVCRTILSVLFRGVIRKTYERADGSTFATNTRQTSSQLGRQIFVAGARMSKGVTVWGRGNDSFPNCEDGILPPATPNRFLRGLYFAKLARRRDLIERPIPVGGLWYESCKRYSGVCLCLRVRCSGQTGCEGTGENG